MRKIKIIFILWFLVNPVFGQSNDLSNMFDWHQSFAGTEHYVGKEILLIPWGSNEGQIPKWEEAITDKYTNSPVTAVVGSFKLKVGKNDDFFIAYSARGKDSILDISETGKQIFLNEDLRDTTPGLDVSKLLVDEKGEIHLLHPVDKTFTKIGVDGKINRFMKNKGSDDKDYENELALFESSLLLPTEMREKNHIVGLQFLDKKTNKDVVTLNSKTANGYQYVLEQKGRDSEGNFYFLTKLNVNVRTIQKGNVYIVYKFSKTGELLTSIYSKIDNFITEMNCPECCFDFDDRGNIYQLYSSEAGLRIIKWNINK